MAHGPTLILGKVMKYVVGQSWVIGRTDVEAETPILWPPDVKNWKKTLMLGKIEGGRRRGQQDEVVGWRH